MDGLVKDLNSIMELQLYLQIAIPAGYLGYLLARLGIRQLDRPTDVVFMSLSLSFSLVSVLSWHLMDLWASPETLQIAVAIFCPILAALLWRKTLYPCVMNWLHLSKIANSTPFPNTWTEIIANTKVGVSQVTVFLKSGEALTCDYIYNFENAPLPLMRWDTDGNIAIYVTQRKEKDKTEFVPVADAPKTTNEGTEFFRLTYILKSEIENVEIVLNKPIS